MPLILPSGITINNTIGACETGVIFACVYYFLFCLLYITILTSSNSNNRMFGITTIQAYHYFQNSRRDPLIFKSIVCTRSLKYFEITDARIAHIDIFSMVCSSIYVSDLTDANNDERYRMIDVFHFSITFHIIYFYSILHYGDIFALLSPTW